MIEGRLYELIRDYQRERAAILRKEVLTFRLSSIRAYAANYPSRYPEYAVNANRLPLAVQFARTSGDILPPNSGSRDDLLWLRVDNDSVEA